MAPVQSSLYLPSAEKSGPWTPRYFSRSQALSEDLVVEALVINLAKKLLQEIGAAHARDDKIMLPKANPTNPPNTPNAQFQQSSKTPSSDQLQQLLVKHIVAGEYLAIGPTEQSNGSPGPSVSKDVDTRKEENAQQEDSTEALETEPKEAHEG